jgi:hypothetical protein
MQDFIGNELFVGDMVIIVAPNYRSLVLGKVIKFTPVRVKVAYMNTWNYGNPGHYQEVLQTPDQVIKIEGARLTEYLIKNSVNIVEKT